MRRLLTIGIVALLLGAAAAHAGDAVAADRDILVTFENAAARNSTAGVRAPYRHRKRYAITATVRRDARDVAAEYELVEIDHWPIRSLSVYCFVFRVSDAARRADVIKLLQQDARVESAQAMSLFETSVGETVEYDDTYAKLQHGLQALDVLAAHRASTGRHVRVAIIDSHTDTSHEDLRGRISRHRVFADRRAAIDSDHGTAVASVIGARANNARGIVGVAPGARLEVFVSCWRTVKGRPAVCDSFTLLKALDTMLDEPPDILNLSLVGPHDTLVERVLSRVIDAGVVVVAARPTDALPARQFPSSMDGVLAVGRSDRSALDANNDGVAPDALYAPGDRILVAAPNNNYEFKTGSSLSAAHVTGVVALLLDVAPDANLHRIRNALLSSQMSHSNSVSVNACHALKLLEANVRCAD